MEKNQHLQYKEPFNLRNVTENNNNQAHFMPLLDSMQTGNKATERGLTCKSSLLNHECWANGMFLNRKCYIVLVLCFCCYMYKNRTNGKTHYIVLWSQKCCLFPGRWQLLEGKQRSVVFIMFYSPQLLENEHWPPLDSGVWSQETTWGRTCPS